jgi:hypothetical protein
MLNISLSISPHSSLLLPELKLNTKTPQNTKMTAIHHHKKETQQHPQISFSPFPGNHTIQQQQKTIKPSTNITNAKASHIIQKHKHNSTFSPPPINPNLTPADSLIVSLLPTPTPQPTNPSPQ